MGQHPDAPQGSAAEAPHAHALPPLPKDSRLYEERIRGGWLTFLLVAKFVGNAIAAITYGLVICGVLTRQGVGAWIALVYLLLVLTNITAIAALWNWQKWGLYLLIGGAVMIFALNVSLGLLRWPTVAGLFGPLLILVAVWPRWPRFE
jgi:hypothetical protein